MKREAMIVGVLAVVSITAVAQENRSEIRIRDRHRWISGWLSLQLQSLACSRGELRI
jgi:hypothetical protein